MRRLRADPIRGSEVKRTDIERIQKWERENPDDEKSARKIYSKQWRKDNPEKVRKQPARIRYQKLSKASRRENDNRRVSVSIWRKVLAFFSNSCAYCGSSLNIEKDHFVPYAKGGKLTKDNTVPACRVCNNNKSDTMPLDWLVEQEHGLSKFADITNFLDNL